MKIDQIRKALSNQKSYKSLYLSLLQIAILLVAFSATDAFSQNIVKIDQQSIKHIGKNTFYFEDPTSSLSLDDILSDSIQNSFEVQYQDAPNFSSTASAYWVKFEVLKEREFDPYLEVGTAFMDSITLYEIDPSGKLISVRHSGDDLPFSSREVGVGSFLFELNIPTDAIYTYYLRIKSTQPLFFPLRVGSLTAFAEFNHDLDYIQGIYFGFMLLIFLYNLFLFFTTKDNIYLYYIAYVFSITWFMASVYGYFFEYLWPDNPAINQNVVISSGLTMITATLFTQKFLDIKNHSIKLYYGTLIFLVIGVLVCLLVAFGEKILGLQVAQGGLLSMGVFFLFLGIYFKLKGREEATYYLLAWGALLIGIIFGLLESLNLTPVMPYINAMQIGSALEALLLSFALGEKINTYKKQKEEAITEALLSSQEKERVIREQNITLEKVVKKRTEKIAEQNEELQALNEEKNQLIGIVAHDLRSPLNQIRGLIHLLRLDSDGFTKENKGMLDQMQKSAERQTEMISRILDVNAVESKTINLDLKLLDIVLISKAVVNNYRNWAIEKSIDLEFKTIGEKKFFAKVDENYLIQVLENLISNAIKFSPKNCEVKVQISKTDNFIDIEVCDDGPGISEQDQLNLFKPYQRLSAKPTDGESSTGLGLSIAKKYVDAMKGQLLCKSIIGRGTTFIVRFTEAVVY